MKGRRRLTALTLMIVAALVLALLTVGCGENKATEAKVTTLEPGILLSLIHI